MNKKKSKSNERIRMDEVNSSRETLSSSNSLESAQGQRGSSRLPLLSHTRPALEQVAVRPLTPAES